MFDKTCCTPLYTTSCIRCITYNILHAISHILCITYYLLRAIYYMRHAVNYINACCIKLYYIALCYMSLAYSLCVMLHCVSMVWHGIVSQTPVGTHLTVHRFFGKGQMGSAIMGSLQI